MKIVLAHIFAENAYRFTQNQKQDDLHSVLHENFNYYRASAKFINQYSLLAQEHEICDMLIITAPAHTTKSVTTGIIPNNGVRR